MRRAIYTSFAPYFYYCALQLKESNLLDPGLWIVHGDYADKIRSSFPKCIMQDFLPAIKGLLAEEIDKIPQQNIIDEGILNEHSFTEVICLDMMNRNDMTLSYSYYERKIMFRRYLLMSFKILDSVKPDLVLFEEEPHQPFLYVLYRECLRRGIATQMFTYTIFPKKIISFESFEIGNKKLVSKMITDESTLSYEALPIDIRSLINKIRGNYEDAIPNYMLWQYDVFNNTSKKYLTRLKSKLKYNSPGKAIKRYLKLTSLKYSDQKHPEKPFIGSMNTPLEYRKWEKNVKKENKKLLRYYNLKTSKKVDLNSKFIYFTLHYQPERTTSPIGGQYSDQYLAIDLIAKSIPKGYKIYVKEHISQFVITQFGNQTRTEGFYDRIERLENVELVPLETSSFVLIDNCVAVASITGTVLFEALVRGKPGIHFGEVFYKGFYGTFYVKTKDELDSALQRILNFEFEENRLYACLSLFYSSCVDGVIGKTQTEAIGLSQRDNGQLHYNAIRYFLANELNNG